MQPDAILHFKDGTVIVEGKRINQFIMLCQPTRQKTYLRALETMEDKP